MAAEIASITPNPYIFNIENRRRKARLAHEIGEGAKCRKCEEKCAGFQLHYWRKICVNCRCGKDDHEVVEEEEDFGQVVIGKLFDRPIRTAEEEKSYSHETKVDMVNEMTGKTEKITFDWVPPKVTKDLVKKYMEQLPAEKRPIAGSEAAKMRRRHLEQQLPLYDVDENERCENMEPDEFKNFQKHLELLRTRVAGQASILEIVTLLPKQTSLALTKPEVDLPPPPPRQVFEDLPPTPEEILAFEAVQNNLNNNQFGQPHRSSFNESIRDTRIPDRPSTVVRNTTAAMGALSLNQDETPSKDLPTQKVSKLTQTIPHPYTDSRNQNEALPPSNWSSTGSKTDAVYFPTGVATSTEIRNRPNELYSTVLKPSGQKQTDGTTTIDPADYKNVYEDPVRSYEERTSGIPNMVPRGSQISSVAAYQAPYGSQRDTLIGVGSLAASGGVNVILPSESKLLGDAGRHKPLPTSNFCCQHCEDPMRAGDVAVICERAGAGKYWHPSCFVCATCKELLADLIYFYKDGRVYCGRHYHEAAEVPRCRACDELIFVESWTRADGFDWHVKHFCCFVCDRTLGGSKYIADARGYPHCLPCYMSFLAKMCESCEEKISPEEPRTGYHGYSYHASPKCFCCFSCRKSLFKHKFKMAKNWVFCSHECMAVAQDEIERNPNPKEKEASA